MLLSATTFEPSESGKFRIFPWLMFLVYPVCRLLLLIYFRQIEISGQENMPKQGPVIIAPTHRSRWDALLVSLAVGRGVSGRDLRFMVTATEMTGIQGWFIRHLGGFPIDLKHPEFTILAHSVALLKEGEWLVIFPEGGIFRDNKVHPLKRGVGRIALEVLAQQPDSSIQILPIGLQYDPSCPTWGSQAKIEIGKPLAVSDYKATSMKSSSEALTLTLQQCLQALIDKSLFKIS